MGRERIVNLENMEISAPNVPEINRCSFLSVNVESTNRAEICGSRRKSAVNNARYLRDGWKTIRPATGRQSSAGHQTIEGGSNG